MSRTRIKSVTIAAAQTRAEAEDKIERIGLLQRSVSRLEADMNDQLSQIKAQHGKLAKPHQLEIESLFASVQSWAEVNRSQLCKGKLKTARLNTGDLSWRVTPFKVTIRGQGKVMESLKALRLSRFIRKKEEINKEAILADTKSRDAASAVAGISVQQVEEFVIKPFESELEKAGKSTATQPKVA